MNGAEIRKIRKLSKLTQVAFASKIGISRELLTGIENDKFPVSRATEYAISEYVKSLKNPQKETSAQEIFDKSVKKYRQKGYSTTVPSMSEEQKNSLRLSTAATSSAALELLCRAIRREDVDLEHQRFKIVDKKGKISREKWCAIKTVALPYWQEVLRETLPGQYLFARHLVPGDTPIGADKISKRWKRLVKDELGIEADFYSLKHSSADDIAQLYGLAAAQGFIGHTSEKVTRIYATGQCERDLDAMKRIDNKFSEE